MGFQLKSNCLQAAPGINLGAAVSFVAIVIVLAGLVAGAATGMDLIGWE